MPRKGRTRTPPEQRRVQFDRRTKVARRLKVLERELRAEVERTGRSITIHDNVMIGSLAQAALRMELLKGDQSRGVLITDLNEQLTRLGNMAQRLTTALGLRHAVLSGPRSTLHQHLSDRANSEDWMAR
jgi:hypothetical protein